MNAHRPSVRGALIVCALIAVTMLLAAAVVTGEVPELPGGNAAADGEKVERKGPLAGLPSAAGPTVEKIRAMGADRWLNLGPPAGDPKWGKARGRSWGCKMPYAADLGGAFLNGTGVHAFMTPDGRYTDDIFFYDLNAHRWICIYPGTDSKTFLARITSGELKVNEDGQLVDRAGLPVPYAAIPHHSYQAHTYDDAQRKYVIGWGGGGLGGDQYTVQMDWDKQGRKLLVEQRAGRPDRVAGTPFFFNTVAGQFERPPLNGAKLHGAGTGGVFCYLPSRKTLWLFGGGATQVCDPATDKWSNTAAKGPTPQGIDFAACYDPKRDRIYVGGGSYRGPWGKDEGYLFVYDVKTNTWSNAPNKGNPPRSYGSNVALMHYDAAGGRVVHVVHGEDERGVFVYDPESAEWGEAPLPIPAEVGRRGECWSGFYCPELNAHFFYTAGDSRDSGVMWVYRYKAKAAEKPIAN